MVQCGDHRTLTAYTSGGVEKVIALFGAFVEVLPHRVRVLADRGAKQADIDAAAALQELAAALQANENMHGEADPAVALAEMQRAQAKVDAVERRK